MSSNHYDLETVMKMLNKSRSTVIRETNTGKIPSEGEKRNRKYPKEAIDAMVELARQKQKKNKAPSLVFSPSTPNDTWQEVQIGRELYGDDDIVPYKQLLEWGEVNDEMYMSLKLNNKVVGYSSLMPLDESVLLSLLRDEIRERDIPLDAIKQWSDSNLSVYVASVTVKPLGEETDNAATREGERAGIIIKNTIKWALSLDRQFNIKNWYSIGATKDGQELLEGLGFKEILSLYNGERKGYYMDDVKQATQRMNKILHRLNAEPLEIT
jgi:hypothetical protein